MNRSATIARKRILVVWTVAVMSAASLAATAHAAAITYDVEFTDYAGGPELQWLDKKGYEPERDADNSKKVVVSHTKSGLVLETYLLDDPDHVGCERLSTRCLLCKGRQKRSDHGLCLLRYRED